VSTIALHPPNHTPAPALFEALAEKPTETTLKAFIYQLEFGFPKQILNFVSI
jgi:hypothetical protein